MSQRLTEARGCLLEASAVQDVLDVGVLRMRSVAGKGLLL